LNIEELVKSNPHNNPVGTLNGMRRGRFPGPVSVFELSGSGDDAADITDVPRRVLVQRKNHAIKGDSNAR